MRCWFFRAVILLLSAGMCACSGREESPVGSVLEASSTLIDSLYMLVVTAPAKDFIPHANNLFYHLANAEITDSLIQYNTAAPVDQVHANVNYWMGEYLLAEGRYSEALASAKLALDGAKNLGDDDLALETHSLLSVIYFRLGMLNDALENLQVCYDADSRAGDKSGMSSDLNNMAAMALQAKQYANAKEYIDRAIEIERGLGRPDVLAVRLGIASETYASLDMLAEAEAFAREAYSLDVEGGRDCKAAIRLSQLATVLIKRGNDAEALATLTEAAPMLYECGNMYSFTVTQCQLGDLCLSQGDNGQAADHYRSALEMADSTQAMYLQQRALKGLWTSLKDADIAHAAPYLERYAQVSDSIFGNKGLPEELVRMQTRFETKQLEFERERLMMRMRTNRTIAWCVALVLLFGILWLVYALYAHRKVSKTIRNLERIRSNFFTNITHEFRTPLTAILGLSRDIADKHFTCAEDNARAVEIINRQSSELLSLVNQLLDISKVRSQIGHPEWRHGDIVGFVSMIVQNFRQMAVDKHIELIFASVQSAIEMDFVPDYIGKIVRNLLSNALKYTGEGGHVTVELISKGDKLLIRVSDDGVGIPKSELPNIFDPYYSGSGGSVDPSTGIGLSLVNEMVKVLNGTIKVNSQQGKGSIFVISLPITYNMGHLSAPEGNDTVVATKSQHAADVADIQSAGKVALIVEDNTDLAFYIGSHLPKDFALYYAQNGQEGLDKAIHLIPDIVITDIMMPQMDGIELVRQLRNNPIVNHIPVIAITAKVNDDDRVEGLRAGFDAYLAKPFNSEELSVRVIKLLEQRQLLQQKFALAAGSGTVVDQDNVHDSLMLAKLADYVYSQLEHERPVDIESCAKHMKYSSRQLSRKIQAVTGDTLNKYINRVRIEYAKRLLNESPSLSITTLSMRCGAVSPEYFTRQFRQFVGMTPTQYVKTLRAPHPDKPTQT